jgi:hypothetical protein
VCIAHVLYIISLLRVLSQGFDAKHGHRKRHVLLAVVINVQHHTLSDNSFPNASRRVVFAKLRKATVNFIMSVCLSVRMEQLGTDFHEIGNLGFV